MPTSNTPLRYPGGKSRLANFMKIILLHNNLCPVHYVEPFAGGAGLGITLLLHGYAKRITLNDIDPLVYSFWKSALEDTDDLCKLISSTRVSMAEWYRQREVVESPNGRSRIELAFAAIYLNRCNRSGILRGGVIGGQEQSGPWKMDARFNKDTLIKKIKAVAACKSSITVCKRDAGELLKDASLRSDGPLFWYLDPPYYVKGQELYENHYVQEDHVALAKLVSELKDPWIVSYDNAAEIKKLFQKYRQYTYGINYSAGDHYSGREVAFFSSGLRLPSKSRPLNVSRASVRKRAKAYANHATLDSVTSRA